MRPQTSERIYRLLAEAGDHAPTIGEIAQATGLARSVVHYHLQRLVEAGLVVKRDMRREGLYRAVERSKEEEDDETAMA